MELRTKRILVAASFAAIVLRLWWLAEAQSSPLRWYFHSMISRVLLQVSFPAVILGVMFSGNVQQPNEFVTYMAGVLERFGFGYLLAVIMIHPRRKGGQSAERSARKLLDPAYFASSASACAA